MIKIKQQYIEKGKVITEYENGIIVKSAISEQINLDNLEKVENPILGLKEENTQLKQRIVDLENLLLQDEGVI